MRSREGSRFPLSIRSNDRAGFIKHRSMSPVDSSIASSSSRLACDAGTICILAPRDHMDQPEQKDRRVARDRASLSRNSLTNGS